MTDEAEVELPAVTEWYIGNILPSGTARHLEVFVKTLVRYSGWEVRGVTEDMANEEGNQTNDGVYRSRLFSVILVKRDASDLWCGFNQAKGYPVLELMVMNNFTLNVNISANWGSRRECNTWKKYEICTFNHQIDDQQSQVDLLSWIIDSTYELMGVNQNENQYH